MMSKYEFLLVKWNIFVESYKARTEYPWGSKTLKETPKIVKKINIGG